MGSGSGKCELLLTLRHVWLWPAKLAPLLTFQRQAFLWLLSNGVGPGQVLALVITVIITIL